MKKLIFLILALAVMFTVCSCSSKEDAKNDDSSEMAESHEEYIPLENIYGKIVNVEMKIKDFGIVTMELYPDEAPITVDNFVKKVNDGFYNGLIFHKVIAGFIVQGGDPTGTGEGRSDLEKIKGEFSANGVNNNIPHKKGVVSMARKSGFDSATSQFFICTASSESISESLDGKYAAFGCVTSGMEIIELVSTVSVNNLNKPIKDVIIEYIKVI